MDTRDREAIEGLFSKLGDVERQAGPRDAEAERFIADSLTRQPGAPYYMAQTIVMQEMAIANQQKRIEEMERAAQTAAPSSAAADQREPEGGMLSRIFGSGPARSVPNVGSGAHAGAARSGSAWGNAAGQARNAGQNAQAGAPQRGRGFGGGMGGGGFLAGAAQTAMGVAGGVLLGNALGNMFGGNEAQAADATPATEPADTQAADTDAGNEPDIQDASADDGGWFGGDDGGGFDDI
ncbi:hypothetical protein Sa4125_32130 [Aureimonas sp. SA4125]|uniref:DUF2076 domain-containing protein n=1 Tax=Aureimonas sp. SA4125 TaxID=2826993 RepID=UPI001CC46E58|nr:DUF2076 domain-containing protein [Aureimonas sp. SA4125]BDA85671.1 hypothetical protein Sa4125_32130 [Aureimonas sp. SA4125]